MILLAVHPLSSMVWNAACSGTYYRLWLRQGLLAAQQGKYGTTFEWSWIPKTCLRLGWKQTFLSSDVVCLHITLAQLLKPLLPRDPATESSPQYGCLRPRQIRRLVGIEMDWTIGTLQPGYRCDSQQKGMVDSPGGLETSSVVAAAVLTSNPPIYVELWLQQGLSQLAKGPWSAEILESPSGFAKWQAKPSYWSTQPNLEGNHFHSLNFLACGAVCFFIFAQAVKLWCRSLFGNSFK